MVETRIFVDFAGTWLMCQLTPQDKNNPLDVSPANTEVSKQRSPQEGGAQDSGESERPRTSGGSNPNKGSKVA